MGFARIGICIFNLLNLLLPFLDAARSRANHIHLGAENGKKTVKQVVLKDSWQGEPSLTF